MNKEKCSVPIEVILGNSNSRFSGVTSTMLQTLQIQRGMLGVRVMGKHHLPDLQLAISFLEVIKMCRQPLPSGKYRVFHARRNDEMIQALILKYLFGAKIRIIFTSTAQRYHSGLTRWLMGQMDGIISTCDAAASYLKTPANIIIPHGVQTQNYYPAENKQELWQQHGFSGEYGIGIFGRVRKQKGVHLFVNACLDAFKYYSQYTAIIVGAISADNQSFVEQLKEKIADQGMQNRILFLGEQPFDKIPSLIRSVSILAALSDNEGFGLTPLEALSSSTAVLATKAGAWPEIIENGVNGLIEEVGDQEAITATLTKMLGSPEQLEIMGKNGREQVLKNYTVEQEAHKLCQFYRQIQSAPGS